MVTFSILQILLFLSIQQVSSEEAELVLRAERAIVQMGYCFGADDIVVYRRAPDGDQLLGNSSDDSTLITPPADLRGRIHIKKDNHLLGLQIHNLTEMDSGIYRKECWTNQTLVSNQTQQLIVCDQETRTEVVTFKEEAEESKVWCNSHSIGQNGTTVRWYQETQWSNSLKLFVDSSVSLVPLGDELQSNVEVRDDGQLLFVRNSWLKNQYQFYCQVIKGTKCLSFQNMYLPVYSEFSSVFASQGDRVVLSCPLEGNNQRWETPLGTFNGSRRNNTMFVSISDESPDYSLVISAVSEEHSGEYSCITPSLEMQYTLSICPRKQPKDIFFHEGSNIELECDVSQDNSHRVQWYRRETDGKHELIHDSNDESVPVPEDLRGRMSLSDSGSSLTLSHVESEKIYWCVVLEFVEADDDYQDDYDEGDVEELDDEQYWDEAHSCIFKQESVLRVTTGTSLNTHVYAIGAGLAGLAVVLVVGVIIALAIRRRRTGVNTNTGGEMNEDSACTERLTHNTDV